MRNGTIVAGPAWFNWSESQRMLAIADSLDRLGYEIILLGEGTYDRLIGNRPYERIILEEDSRWFTPEREKGMLDMEVTGNQYAGVREIRSMVEAEIDLLSRLRPQAALTGYRPTLTLSTRICHIPLIWCLSAVLSKPYARLRQQRLQDVPGMSRVNKKNRMEDYTALRSAAADHIAGDRQQKGAGTSKAWNQVLASYHVPLLQADLDLLKGDLNLMSDAPELFPEIGQADSSYVWTGPILNRMRIEMPAEARFVLEAEKKKEELRVLVSLGSASTAGTLRRVLTALDHLPGTVLATNIGKLSADEMSNCPKHIRFFEKLPLIETAKQCDFAVIAGGQGTIYAMLAAGCPFISVPAAYEQQLNAENIRERLGCCDVVFLHELKGKRLEKAIRNMRENLGVYREHAEKASVMMRPYVREEACFGENQAAGIIDGWLRQWR